MKTALLFLLLVKIYQTSAQTKAFLNVSPAFSQFFEYQRVILTCESSHYSSWTVWRYTSGLNPVLSHCGTGWGHQISSSCHINTTKLSDSGVYWCESKQRESSNAVNITVVGGAVILQSPVVPVAEGDNVTLHCRTKNSSALPAEFFKGENSIGSNNARHMTIRNFSKSHEGTYSCEVGANKSSTSWLLMKDDSNQASLKVDPDSSQIFEYRTLKLHCGDHSTSRGWRVTRNITFDQKFSSCGDKWGHLTQSGCQLNTTKKTDSAIYWCESLTRQRSSSVDLIVHGGPVILQIPVRQVMKGHNVTLHCRYSRSSKRLAEFYRVDNDKKVIPGPEGHMTIYNVSVHDEGQYKCHVLDKGQKHESLPSWLYVYDPDAKPPPSPASPWLFVYTVLRYVVLPFPYIFCTKITVSLFQDRKKGKKQPDYIPMSPSSTAYEVMRQDPSYDDVIPDVTTEHRF